MTDYFYRDLWLSKSVNRVQQRERGGGDQNKNSSGNIGSDLLKKGMMREGDAGGYRVGRLIEADQASKNSGDEKNDHN